jgi:RNA polymerase primary sigma factor
MVQAVIRWKRATERFRQRVGRPPSPHELAAEMRVPVAQVWAIARAARGTRDIFRARGGDGEPIEDPVMLASDEREEPSEQRIARGESGRTVRRLLDVLGRRDAEIVRERFGLDGRSPQTCREIAQVHGVTGERVRQILRDVLFALRVRARSAI